MVVRGADAITEALVEHIGVIADDSMLGRATPSRGLELTAAYIAARFRRLGLTPGGDSGSFLQRYEIPGPPAGSRASARGRSGAPAIAVSLSTGGGAPPSPGTAFDSSSAPNVVGILEGTDPALKREFVVFSAHMDHVGVNAANARDSIWNGADDDASGTAGVLALAEAFARAPTRRSIIFLTVSGEERGLWGSEWFAKHPPVRIGQLVANLNLDMIGRNWKDTIVAIGKEHSDLGATLHRVNAAHPELRMNAIDDPWPQENFYGRSDHYNFARRGVPVLFFFNGTHADYHQPGDSPDKIDAEKAARVVKLIYYVGQDIGNTIERPTWNPDSYRKIVQPR